MSVWDWRAHISQDFNGFGDKVVLYRRIGDSVDVMTGWDENGNPVIERHTPDAEAKGIRLPEGAAEAIAEAVKPGPSTSELAVLNEALGYERNRVDNALQLVRVVVERG